MKKLLTSVLTVMLAVILAACGTYTDPITKPGDSSETDTTASPPKGEEDPPGGSDAEFTVSVTFNGAPYTPESPMQVQWSDGYNFKRADVDENGIARTTGLDGDYSVTLTSVPEGYTYNCNGYTATNDRRNITLELHQIIKTFGTGSGLYSPDIITISKTGMYRARLKNEQQVIYYEFKPTRAGTYSIESYMDLTDNRFNPILDVHFGNASWKPKTPTEVINGGGASSTFTSNFRYVVQVDKSMLGCVFAFGIHLDSIDGVYPSNLDFAVQYNGSFELEFVTATVMVPEEKFKTREEFIATGMNLSGTWTWAETQVGSRYVFDASMYKLNPDDGYYYLCDTYGNLTNIVLCAKISSACRYIDKPFTTIEAEGNKALTVSGGTENYKSFIENEYGTHCFNDGVYPVTQELREFLQKYSINQRLFMDGNGWVETFDPPIFAAEDAQYLFACGYFLPAGQTTQSVVQGSARSATLPALTNGQLSAPQADTSSPAPAALCPGKCDLLPTSTCGMHRPNILKTKNLYRRT